jgi:hypothetical protein
MRDPRLLPLVAALTAVLAAASLPATAASAGPRLVPGTQVPIWTDGGLPLAQRPPPGTDLSTIGQAPIRGWRHAGPRGHHARHSRHTRHRGHPHGHRDLAPGGVDRRAHGRDGRIVDCVPRTSRVIVITDRPRCAAEPARSGDRATGDPVRVSREMLDRLRD